MDNSWIVQIVPAEGWRVAYAFELPGGGVEARSFPLAAWGLTAAGEVVPLEVDGNGIAEDPTTCGNFVALVPPGDYDRREPALDDLAREMVEESG